MKKYDDKYSTCKRTYATLRVLHKELDPDEISNLLGLSYSRAYRKGDPITAVNEIGERRNGVWLLDTKQKVDSLDSRRHIDWLLDQLEGKADVVRALFNKGCNIDILCFWESAHGHGGPTVSPEQSIRLGEMRVDLMFDVYFAFPEESDDCDRPRS